MSDTPRDATNPAFYYWLLLAAAGLCFLATIGVGLLSGVATAMPEEVTGYLSLRILRPMHTLLALFWLFSGTAAAVGLFTNENKRADRLLAGWQCNLYLLFLVGAGASIAAGKFSGREYISWPPFWTIALFFAFVLTAVSTLMRWRKIVKHSPEAGWFLIIGMVLLPIGLVESHFYLIGDTALDVGRDVTIQWHALDTVIAAWSINLYAVAMLLLPPHSKPMRSSWLFILAVIGILLDFGHHNYATPQAHFIKIVAFTATMLAIISFWRHMRVYRRNHSPPTETVGFFMRHIEFWTLFAVGTGIMMAVPQINMFIHGTYAVVAHTMGAMIGVNSFILFAAAAVFSGGACRIRPAMIRWTTLSLILFCVALTGLGIARGVLRVDQYFIQWIIALRPWYILIPISAIPLTICLAVMGVDLVRSCAFAIRAIGAPEEESEPVPAREVG